MYPSPAPASPSLLHCLAGDVSDTLTAVLHKMGVLPGCDTVSLGKWP